MPIQRKRISRTVVATGIAAATLCLLAGGCGQPSGGTAYTSLQTYPLTDTASRDFQIDIDVLAEVLPRAIDRMHWAKLHMHNELTALHAAALTDDDRHVDIRAQAAADGTVNVQVKVGYFHDADLESQFLDALAERIEHWQDQQRK